MPSNNFHQVGQLSSGELPSEPVDTKVLGSSETNSKKRKLKQYLVQSDRFNGNTPGQVSIEAYHNIHFLQNRRDNFRKEIESSERSPLRGARFIPHKHLKIGRYFKREKDKPPVTILKVLDASLDETPKNDILAVKYNQLIRWMYVIHEKQLNALNIPTFMHSVRQRKLFDWLDEELLTSKEKRLPIFGMVKLSHQEWGEDDEFGDSQVELIHYFSLNGEEKEKLAPNLATSLVQRFQEEDPKALNDAGGSDKIFSSAALQKSNEKLRQSLTNDHKFETIVNAKRWPLSGDYLPKSTLEYFKYQLKKLNEDQNAKQSARSVHPKLPVSVYFFKKMPDYQMVRILENTPNKGVVRFNVMYNKFWKLVLATTYIHLKVSQEKEMTKLEYQQSRE
ncbi:uncharacterized protein PGTG_18073 [Puccinia graminis f. sp. tritici CRL 75-36-700-3]|uniref:Uncharacterized protein n=1 Tax=Puccinia graminis f. sp. tritici (strain CRL 75-36-700-3 / race SCCL) TaxID=418459 RepID=E3L5Q4_PUCGT|nr:uncharacterized protein PGTG_18073 [Puccinia graminis f. sp. tritici CRL 75-36-700-3]EFP91879.2 hypothetical protein PGTG_18073 [Puccinia graminis f. sp. tritici CRL 75-36-700-3]